MKTKASTGALTKVLCAFVFAMFVLVFANTTTWAAPAKVTEVKQTKATSSSISLSWSTNSLADYYRYEISSDGKTWPSNKSDWETDGNGYFYGLSANSTYYVRVRGYNATSASYYTSNPSACELGEWSDVVKVVTAPDAKTQKITGTAATTSSLSFKWTAVSGADGYQVEYYVSGNSSSVKTINTTKNSCKLTKLSADTEYNIYVYAYKKGTNFLAVSSNGTYASGIPTLAKKVSGFGNTGVQNKYAYFSWNKKSVADGFQIYMTKQSDSKKFKNKWSYNTSYNTGTASMNNTKIKLGAFYSAKIRPYVTLYGTNKKVYGDWSNVITFGSRPKDVDAKQSSSSIKVSWTKVTGATGYEIYASTSSSKGYVKVATVKGGSKKNCTIKKFKNKALKSGKYYWISVRPIMKSGSKTYKTSFSSTSVWQDCVYYYKRK